MTIEEARAAIDAAFDRIDPRWRTRGLATRPEPNYSLAPRPDGKFDYVLVSAVEEGQPAYVEALRAALGEALGRSLS